MLEDIYVHAWYTDTAYVIVMTTKANISMIREAKPDNNKAK